LLKFLDEFLDSIPSMKIKLSDPEWSDLFGEAMKRLQGVSNIQRLLSQIAAHYKEPMKATDFVTDLLKVETPELFAICQTKCGKKSEYEAAVHGFMQNFIVENHLKHQLLQQ